MYMYMYTCIHKSGQSLTCMCHNLYSSLGSVKNLFIQHHVFIMSKNNSLCPMIVLEKEALVNYILEIWLLVNLEGNNYYFQVLVCLYWE